METLDCWQILLNSSLYPFPEYSHCPKCHISFDFQISPERNTNVSIKRRSGGHSRSFQILCHFSQICSVKTSIWYTIKHQQNLKILPPTHWLFLKDGYSFSFKALFFVQIPVQRNVPIVVLIPVSYSGCDYRGLTIYFFKFSPIHSSNRMFYLWVLHEMAFSFFFNTSSCSFSVIHASHLVMVLFSKWWAKISLYIPSVHWALKSLYIRTSSPLVFSALHWYFFFLFICYFIWALITI